ncbi:MAG TPA: GntR family transcriptional regulator, partial [Bacillota bacterium]
EGEPLAVERSLIPAALCPPMATADLEQRSLYDILSEYGLTVARAEEWLEPITAGAFAARHLGVARGAPAFRVERVCYDASQRPLEFRESVIRGDRYRFHVELTR